MVTTNFEGKGPYEIYQDNNITFCTKKNTNQILKAYISEETWLG